MDERHEQLFRWWKKIKEVAVGASTCILMQFEHLMMHYGKQNGAMDELDAMELILMIYANSA